MPRRNLLVISILLLAFASALSVAGRVANGFDLSDALIPPREIRAGGPPRDGIPALTDPPRETAKQADRWLEDGDRVMGVALGGEAVAYPIRILNWHELVNDVVRERPVLVSYCPLCGTGVVFDATLGGRRATFGVSGLLYNSDALMYERRTESLFSQLLSKGVTGPLKGAGLETVPARTTTWKAWKRDHPETEVLTRALPHGRDYGRDPYESYRRGGPTMFPVRGDDTSRPAKSWAYLVRAGDETAIVAEKVLEKKADGAAVLEAKAAGLRLRFEPEARELTATRGGEELTVVPGYWFALTAFHPGARLLGEGDLIVREDSGRAGKEGE